MAKDIFQQYTRFGDKLNGIPDTASFQTQTAVPFNIQTPYSQVEDDDGLKPLSASDIKGGRYFDAVVDCFGTGDYLNIQSALNAGNKKIFVKSGIYTITNSINIYGDNILIVGESKYETIIRASVFMGTAIVIFNIGSSGINITNFRISNISIDGSRDVLTGYSYAFVLYKCHDIKIDDCYIYNCDYGVISSGATGNYIYNINIINNFIFDTGLPIYCAGNSLATETYNWWITNNYLLADDDTGAGLYLVACRNILFKNNYVDSNRYPIYCYGGHDCIISGNILNATGNFSYGINITNNPGNNTNNIQIINNIITNSYRSGIYLYGTSYNIISGNHIINCGQIPTNTYSAIIMESTPTPNFSTHNIISNNIITSNTIGKYKYGIEEKTVNDDYNIITKNIIQGYGTDRILTNGFNTIVSNNL